MKLWVQSVKIPLFRDQAAHVRLCQASERKFRFSTSRIYRNSYIRRSISDRASSVNREGVKKVRLLQFCPIEGERGRHSFTLTTCSSPDHKEGWQVELPISDENRQESSIPSSSSRGFIGRASSVFQRNVLVHFLPARFPTSVASGYSNFALYSFGASVAGSAAMVLSTQTLLLAVGVVGSQQSASIMAGALNWVLKDGMGQLGGVLFASQMGKMRRFDSNPKQWRVASAVFLDAANLMEITAPLLLANLVLPVACVANVLKNIGFLTASASRAALHQSLATPPSSTSRGVVVVGSGSLADVTAKAGTQAMAGGLVGTALGIGLSVFVLGYHNPNNFILGFCLLSLAHQGCTYQSLQHVHLRYFNRHRLGILLGHYAREGEVLSPAQVARFENYLPFRSTSLGPIDDDNDDVSWLCIGSPVQKLAPNGWSEWQVLVSRFPTERYVLQLFQSTNNQNSSKEISPSVHLTFLEKASGQDVVLGMLHAYLLRHCLCQYTSPATTKTKQKQPNELEELLHQSYKMLQSKHGPFLMELERQAWTIDTNSTHVEPSNAVRIKILPLREDYCNT
ncbi:hypothetical protein ACA910_022151 [Epithemia clementina (nom. ined.)]